MTDGNPRRKGRPAKGSLKRSHKVTVAFNDDEYELMLTLAEMSGLSPACWCRKTALKTRMREAFTDEERLLLKDLYKVGTNLNQLLRVMQSRTGRLFDREVSDIIAQFRQINSHFREEVRDGR